MQEIVVSHFVGHAQEISIAVLRLEILSISNTELEECLHIANRRDRCAEVKVTIHRNHSRRN